MAVPEVQSFPRNDAVVLVKGHYRYRKSFYGLDKNELKEIAGSVLIPSGQGTGSWHVTWCKAYRPSEKTGIRSRRAFGESLRDLRGDFYKHMQARSFLGSGSVLRVQTCSS